jgi:hypothetical protein
MKDKKACLKLEPGCEMRLDTKRPCLTHFSHGATSLAVPLSSGWCHAHEPIVISGLLTIGFNLQMKRRISVKDAIRLQMSTRITRCQASRHVLSSGHFHARLKNSWCQIFPDDFLAWTTRPESDVFLQAVG